MSTSARLAHGDREYPGGPVASVHVIAWLEGSVLLIRRGHPPGMGRWSLPGGAVRLGETLREAAERERREECGVEIEVGEPIDVIDNIVYDEQGRVQFHYVVIYLSVKRIAGEIRAGSDALEARWTTREELPLIDMHPLAREVVHRTLGGSQGNGPAGIHEKAA
jgi:ADP-ribose pyrophosphatase